MTVVVRLRRAQAKACVYQLLMAKVLLGINLLQYTIKLASRQVKFGFSQKFDRQVFILLK